ncbi:MAG: PfkB family carbohydrate kinase [Lentisphaeria bacterium]|nr:PfkB family carbohydrate kinase [Lentisphaeria bacterium]
MDYKRFQEIARNFPEKRIAVIGDLMLDVYIFGRTNRISPEAPVPVLEVGRRTHCLGGAANVMRNLVALGGKTIALGVIGDDADGRLVCEEFARSGINCNRIQVDKKRRTTQKQRIIAGAQQLLRVDYEDVGRIDVQCARMMADDLIDLVNAGAVDGIIFEDYGKGVLSEALIERVLQAVKSKNIFTALDPKPGNLLPVKGLGVMKPNRVEAFKLADMSDQEFDGSPADDQQLHEVAGKILEQWDLQYLLISLSAQGMALYDRSVEKPIIIPTSAREVFDVSGAGDTVIATFTLAMCSGATPTEAAILANTAAGVVVGKIGTSPITFGELQRAFTEQYGG